MNIGIDARFYGSIGKGLGRYTQKLIQYLEEIASEDDEYVIFLRKENFEEYIPKRKNFRKELADFSWYGFGEQVLFPCMLYRYCFDLVHFPHFNVPILYWGKKAVTIHDLILFHFPTVRGSMLSPVRYWLKYVAYRVVIFLAIARAETVFVVSEFTRDDVAKNYPNARKKLRVTDEGIDRVCEYVSEKEGRGISKRFRLEQDKKHGTIQKYFLYVGNAYPHKNLEAILDVAKHFPEYLFVLVGKEDYFFQKLKRKSEKIGNVFFAGFVPDRELSWMYRNAVAYLFPSRYEGFGLPGLEAMNYGLPVIAANKGSLPCIYGDAALYFDPDKESDFENAISQIVSEEGKREWLREKGFERIKRYDWRVLAKKTYRSYQKHKHNCSNA